MHQYRLHPFYRFIASLLVLTNLLLTYETAYAQTDFSSIGRSAQQLGKDLADDFNQNSPSLSGNTLIFGGGEQIDINDLYPGTSSTNTRPNAQYFPDDFDQNVDHYKSIYDSGSQMDNAGNAALSSMYADATLDDPVSIQGQAYKIIMDTANRPRPDMTYDPIANVTRDIIGDFDIWEESFGDCSVQSEVLESTRKAHVPDYKYCERVIDRSQDCSISHSYKAGIVEHYSGPLNLDSCGEGCMHVWIGRRADNYWSGWCTIFEENTTVRVINKKAITKAVLEYVEFDDYMQVLVGPIGKETKVYNGPNNLFPPETEGPCELSTSWKRYPNVDVTEYFKDSLSDDGIVNFKIRVSVGDKGEGFGRIKIYYDPKKALIKDEWSNDNECITSANGVEDGAAKGTISCAAKPNLVQGCNMFEGGTVCSDNQGCQNFDKGWKCTDAPVNLGQANCTRFNGSWYCKENPIPVAPRECAHINGILLCDDHFEAPPISSVGPLCREIEVSSDFDFYKGEMECWVDAQGEEQCPYNDGGVLDSCKELENDPQCGFVKSECVDGMLGESGTCYVFEDTWDCGTSVDVPSLEHEKSYECHGEIQCMGSDCLDFEHESNKDFAQVAALLESAQYMAQDMTCSGLGEDGAPIGDENVKCKVFPGNSSECKKAIGGIIDCCKGVSGVSLTDYIVLLKSAGKIDSALMSLSEASAIRSGYKAIRDPITGTWSEVKEMFINVPDGISGAFDLVTDPIGTVQDKLLEHAQNLFSKDFAIGLSNALTVIGYIYAAYNVIKILANMIWPCKKSELELQVDIKLKKCHYNGSYCNRKVPIIGCVDRRRSYCCFSSPLSRILQEQIRKQLGISWGSAKNPSCGALTLEQIEQVDWDKVNLDEWIGILQSTGNWPSSKDLSIESLTGPSNPLNYDGTRVNAIDRAMGRFEDSDVDGVREELSKTYKPYPTP